MGMGQADVGQDGPMTDLVRQDFGDDFTWGVAHASYQVEGAWD